MFGLAVALTMGSAGSGATLPPVAEKFLRLFDQLRQAQAAPGGARQHVSFTATDGEINDYMRYALKATPRPGIESVTVKVFPEGYISTFTMVDFDALERWHPGLVPALLRPVLRGRQSVWVDYRVRASGYQATFSVEKAYYGQIRLPAFFVERMIQVIAARQPEKYDTSKPLTLPFGLKQVSTRAHLVAGEN